MGYCVERSNTAQGQSDVDLTSAKGQISISIFDRARLLSDAVAERPQPEAICPIKKGNTKMAPEASGPPWQEFDIFKSKRARARTGRGAIAATDSAWRSAAAHSCRSQPRQRLTLLVLERLLRSWPTPSVFYPWRLPRRAFVAKAVRLQCRPVIPRKYEHIRIPQFHSARLAEPQR